MSPDDGSPSPSDTDEAVVRPSGATPPDRSAPLREYRAVVSAQESEASRVSGSPASPRLARHVLELPDGHEVTVAVAGHGVPFVVVHGFMAEGFMYAQTLSRLVALGYKVVAIDTAGHGGTEVLPDSERDLRAYVDLFQRALDHLGIRSAVLTGHSMGGRLVAELAARDPRRAIALLLLDPILGRSWDRIVRRARMFPPLLAWRGLLIALDTASTFPWVRDRSQAGKLGRLLAPTVLRHVQRPWRLLAPARAILRSGPSGPVLDEIRRSRTPAVVVHGDRDIVVPLATARESAERCGGHLVLIHGATHSWLLKDPETLPAVVESLTDGPLGEAFHAALAAHGLDDDAPVDAIEAALYEPGSRALAITPELRFDGSNPETGRREPRYRFSEIDLDGPDDAAVA